MVDRDEYFETLERLCETPVEEWLATTPLDTNLFLGSVDGALVVFTRYSAQYGMEFALKAVLGAMYSVGYEMGVKYGRRVDESTEQADLASGVQKTSNVCHLEQRR